MSTTLSQFSMKLYKLNVDDVLLPTCDPYLM